jgi:hypothetical protein
MTFLLLTTLLKAVFRIRISFTANADPAFWVNADPYPDSDQDQDFDDQKLKKIRAENKYFLHNKLQFASP